MMSSGIKHLNKRRRLIGCYLVFCTLLLAFGGCSQEQQDAVRQRRDNLSDIWRCYRDMNTSTGVPPDSSSTLAEWILTVPDTVGYGQASECVVEGDVIVNWNGNLISPNGLGRYVFAFEAATPARGGYVVMGDGKVISMTAKQFANADMLPAKSD